MKRICVVTGSRADYGPMRPLLFALRDAEDFELLILAIEPHLAQGTTEEIEADGFWWRAVDLTAPSNAVPDTAIMLLGDRSEILGAASAFYNFGFPIIHLYGGERTDGSRDDARRHAITKLADLHFVAAEPYRERVIQVGEDPEWVFTVGALATDTASAVRRVDPPEKRVLCTFHPCQEDVGELLAALAAFPQYDVLITGPNSDPGGDALGARLKIAAEAQGWRFVQSLGQDEYLREMARSAVAVGNSSSALVEAPAMGVPSVNVGTRQQGRLLAWTVLSSNCERRAIEINIHAALYMGRAVPGFLPYGGGGVAQKIIDVLRKTDFSKLGIKRFHDLKC